MSDTPFPTITGAHWREAIRRGRTQGNAMLAQIRAAVAGQHVAPLASQLHHLPADGGRTAAPAMTCNPQRQNEANMRRADTGLHHLPGADAAPEQVRASEAA